MNAYFISGLGADKRIFSKLKIDEQINIIHLDWIEPIRKETLASYAHRISEKIDATKPFAIVGVSFGGMIAVEIAKILNPKITIVISSIIKSDDLPPVYKFAGKLKLISLVPAKFLKSSNQLTQNYFFGVRTKTEKSLLFQIVKDTDPYFFKWAIGSILSWKNFEVPKGIYHIHGTRDKILYSKNLKPDFDIKNGTHFMVYQNAKEISELINESFRHLA